jgi:hypothetical protein
MLSIVGWFIDDFRPRLGEDSASASGFLLVPATASFLDGLELLLALRADERVPAIVV